MSDRSVKRVLPRAVQWHLFWTTYHWLVTKRWDLTVPGRDPGYGWLFQCTCGKTWAY